MLLYNGHLLFCISGASHIHPYFPTLLQSADKENKTYFLGCIEVVLLKLMSGGSKLF